MAGFAHAGHDDASLGPQAEPAGFGEFTVDAIDQFPYGTGFDVEHAFRNVDQLIFSGFFH
jgi:hypothetical protein